MSLFVGDSAHCVRGMVHAEPNVYANEIYGLQFEKNFSKTCWNKKKCIFAAESEIISGCRFYGFDEGVGR